MELWKIILISFSIYLSLPIFYFLFQFIFDELRMKFFQHQCESSMNWVSHNIGLYTVVDGLIGAGKTTFVSGIIHYLTVSIKQKASDKIDYVKYKFPEVDFNQIDEIIKHLYKYGFHNAGVNIDHVTNSQLVSSYILKSKIEGSDKTFEDIFGGPIIYKRANIDLSSLEFKDLKVANGEIKRVFENDSFIIDSEGYLLDKNYQRIMEYVDINEVEFDENGNILIDRFLKPIRTQQKGTKDNSIPKRVLVYVDNCLSYLSGYRYLLDYIEAYLALLQNNFVSFQDHLFYSFITHNYAMNLSDDFLCFRDRYLSRDFDISSYHIYFLDEKNMDSISKSTSVFTYVQLDGGSDDLLRLWRHVTKGTSYYLSTTQNSNRITKPEREIGSGFIHILNRQEIIVKKFRYKFYSFLIRIIKYINSFYEEKIVSCKNFNLKLHLKRKLKKFADFDKENPPKEIIEIYDQLEKQYSSKVNKFRKVISGLIVKQEWIFGSSVLVYSGTLYYSSEDVNKSNLDKNKFKDFQLVFPIRYCYSPLDTYRFYYVGDELRRRSIYYSNYYQSSEATIYSLDDIQALVGVFAIKYPIKAALLKQIIDESKEALGLIESKKSKSSNNDECIETDLDDVL